MGVSPDTVMVSARLPTLRSALTVAVNDPVSSIPSRLTVPKPVRAKETLYTPALRSTMRYWPVPSVTAVRTFSMSSGLDASTVTPGRTAPDASLTTPVIEAWANRAVGMASRQANANVIRTEGRMQFFSPWQKVQSSSHVLKS